MMNNRVLVLLQMAGLSILIGCGSDPHLARPASQLSATEPERSIEAPATEEKEKTKSLNEALPANSPKEPTEVPPGDIASELLAHWTPWWTGKVPESTGVLWSKHILKEVDRLNIKWDDIKPSDHEEFCPNWTELQPEHRKGFLLSLISAMSKFESDFNPKLTYTEKFPDRNGNRVISRGLLQLSVSSANAYGCKVDEKKLHDPLVNLSCGVRILTKWLTQDLYIGTTLETKKTGGKGSVQRFNLGGARYWSVLRKTSPKRKPIAEFTRSQPLCQKNG